MSATLVQTLFKSESHFNKLFFKKGVYTCLIFYFNIVRSCKSSVCFEQVIFKWHLTSGHHTQENKRIAYFSIWIHFCCPGPTRNSSFESENIFPANYCIQFVTVNGWQFTTSKLVDLKFSRAITFTIGLIPLRKRWIPSSPKLGVEKYHRCSTIMALAVNNPQKLIY